MSGGQVNTSYHDRRCKPLGFNAAIFRTNRQIHAESTSFFYGYNNFRFKDTASLRAFLVTIGSHASLLRRIEISGHWRHVYRGPSCRVSARLMAKQCINLQNLHIDVTSRMAWPYYDGPSDLATSLVPLFHMLLCRTEGEQGTLETLKKAVTLGNDGRDLVRTAERLSGGRYVQGEKTLGECFWAAVEKWLVDLKKEKERRGRRLRRSGIVRVDYAEDY